MVGTIPPARLLSALLACAWPASAADWPQWRGTDRTGLSTEIGLADEWPEEGPPIEWRIEDLGEGYGAVAVVGARLYVQGTRDEESVVFARDASSGRPLWERALGARLRQGRGNGPRSTPTVVGDDLYVLNGMGELARLSADDGSVRWQFNMLDRFSSLNPRWGISESPLVEGDRLYVMPGGRRGSVVALDRRTGATVWRSSDLRDRASYSSLIAADIGGVRTLIGFTQKAGVGLRAEDGRLLWRYETPANSTANVATPIYATGLVFYTSAYGVGGGALRLRPGAGGVATEEAYFAANLQNHHGGVVLFDGHLYGFFGQVLVCADFETGAIKWRARSVGKGSLTVADGKLFLLGERQRVGLADATPEGYRERGRFRIASHGEPSWAHPVVVGGTLYVRDQNTLTAYEVASSGNAE